MAFFKVKQSAWDRIKAAVAEAADVVSDHASDLGDTLQDKLHDGLDAAQSTHQAVHKKVKAKASAGADAVRGGVAAVGSGVSSGVSALGQGVSAVGDAAGRTANGVVAGAIAGAFASWVMNQYQAVSANTVEARKQREGQSAQGGGDAQAAAAQSGGTAKSAEQGGEGTGENATVKVAEAVSRNLFGKELAEEQKPAAGNAVHYGYGAAVGGLYGGLAELVPFVSVGLGIPYATLVWLLGDEVIVPAMGLSKPPTQTKPADHASAFSAHLVYGVTLDISRRVLRHIV